MKIEKERTCFYNFFSFEKSLRSNWIWLFNELCGRDDTDVFWKAPFQFYFTLVDLLRTEVKKAFLLTNFISFNLRLRSIDLWVSGFEFWRFAKAVFIIKWRCGFLFQIWSINLKVRWWPFAEVKSRWTIFINWVWFWEKRYWEGVIFAQVFNNMCISRIRSKVPKLRLINFDFFQRKIFSCFRQEPINIDLKLWGFPAEVYRLVIIFLGIFFLINFLF